MKWDLEKWKRRVFSVWACPWLDYLVLIYLLVYISNCWGPVYGVWLILAHFIPNNCLVLQEVPCCIYRCRFKPISRAWKKDNVQNICRESEHHSQVIWVEFSWLIAAGVRLNLLNLLTIVFISSVLFSATIRNWTDIVPFMFFLKELRIWLVPNIKQVIVIFLVFHFIMYPCYSNHAILMIQEENISSI